MKKLKVIADYDYGFTIGRTIHVNIQRLWDESVGEDEFTDKFTNTYVHELFHVLFTRIRKKKMKGEEKVIYSLLGDEWEDWIEERYDRDYEGQ